MDKFDYGEMELTYHWAFYSIALKHYALMKSKIEEIEEKRKGNSLSKEAIVDLMKEGLVFIEETSIVIIVFSALTLEASYIQR